MFVKKKMVKKATILKVIRINKSFYGKISPDFVKKYKITAKQLIDADLDVKEDLK